jgi:hypothetical protein
MLAAESPGRNPPRFHEAHPMGCRLRFCDRLLVVGTFLPAVRRDRHGTPWLAALKLSLACRVSSPGADRT